MIAKYITAYIATGIAFAVIDSFWLRTMYTRLYKPEIGELMMANGFRTGPAVAFYLLYIVGMMIFAVVPTLSAGRWQVALVQGAMFGFFCYMTYDLTNHATMKIWSLKVTLLDIAWGTILTGTASAAGYALTNLVFGRAPSS